MQSKISFCDNGSSRAPDNRSLRTSPQTGVAISWFNPTVFKKNLTRFAPVWIIYGLGLCIYIIMFYSQQMQYGEYNRMLGYVRSFIAFAGNENALLNLFYALLSAQLLFGDLFNSRMCNALHAMPLRRETWFAVNCISGLVFSLIPTFVAALVLIPILSMSIVENAWMMALLWFVSTNLQYICCFGIAAFAAMCVGSRFTMAAGYGLVHFGAAIAYWLVDTVYTPMLYGVVTPATLANNLTPMVQVANYSYIEIDDMFYEYEVVEKGLKMSEISLNFTLTEHWWRLFAIAGVGILFAGLAVLLYRKRDLECAGDAVAFPILKPVFQVLCALFVMCAGQFLLDNFLGMPGGGIPVMTIGLVVGWFIGKMLIERSTRVFCLKNWYGLAALAACLAVTLVATHFDILNIEERMPDKDKIETVYFDTQQTMRYPIPEENWEDVLAIHALAVQDRVEEQGLYTIEADGSRELYSGPDRYATEPTPAVEDMLGYEDYVRAGHIRITYEFKDGSYMMRRYNIWTEGEIASLTRKNLSSWDKLTLGKTRVDGEEVDILDVALAGFLRMNITGLPYDERAQVLTDKAEVEAFLEALKLDAQAGLMIQDDDFHRGVFDREEENYYGEVYHDTRESLYVSLEGAKGAWDVRIYPDCVNTMNYLIDRGLIAYTVYPDAVLLPG